MLLLQPRWWSWSCLAEADEVHDDGADKAAPTAFDDAAGHDGLEFNLDRRRKTGNTNGGSCKHGKSATDDAADVPADLNLPIASVDDSCAEVVTSDCPEHRDASEPTVKQDKEAESGAACDGAEQDYLLASAISGQLRHDTTRVTSRTEDKTSTASEEDDFIETLRAALQAAAEQGQLGKESINDLVISRLRDEALRGELCVDSVAEIASDALLLDCG